MAEPARYFIAQIVPDLFRQECVNVGVFVCKNGRVAGRFLGERDPGGGIDARKTRALPFPDVYAQWVAYWKRLMRAPSSFPEEVIRTNGGNYNVIAAGEVADTSDDTPEQIANFLYPLLIGDGGLYEALGIRDEETIDGSVARLREQVGDEFQQAEILASGPEVTLGVPYPVRRNARVLGKTVAHEPAYSQWNGELVAMETVDLTTAKKNLAKDHAGWAAFMFNDIKQFYASPTPPDSRPKVVKTVSIVKVRPVDEDDSTVQYSLNMLKKTSDKIVNWNNANERIEFVWERVNAAQHRS
jgi:hypothetical protein